MDWAEILNELSMPYNKMAEYLISKYGAAKYDYFTDESCKIKNRKLSRTAEGLICHHIREDIGANLSTQQTALLQPFEWQKKENLAYCNNLEHLILHIKIAVMRQKTRFSVPYQIADFFTTGGAYMVCRQINDEFQQNGTTIPWRQRCYQEYCNNYAEYIIILNAVMRYLLNQYDGVITTKRWLCPGSKVTFRDCEGEIIKIENNKETLVIKLSDGSIRKYDSFLFANKFTLADYLDKISIRLCQGFNGFYRAIFNDLNSCDDPRISIVAEKLSIDFIGYGFPQFSSYKLEKDKFGSSSIDEYLSKGLPSFTNPDLKISDTPPIFWRGEIPAVVLENNFKYILRIETSFNIRKGAEPFVRYKETSDFLRYKASFQKTNETNFLFNRGIILSTSDVFDPKTNKYYSSYIDFDGVTKKATVTISLEKEDFELFKKRYKIKSLVLLDGCYFN